MVVGRQNKDDPFGLIDLADTQDAAIAIRNDAFWNGGGAMICAYTQENMERVEDIIAESFLSLGEE
jgi:hypothetical protein